MNDTVSRQIGNRTYTLGAGNRRFRTQRGQLRKPAATSVERPAWRLWNGTRIQRIWLSPDKDKCDGECAVEWAFQHGCNKVLLLAAWGGRVDQALGNCALLMRYPGRLALWDDGILVVAMSAGQEAVLPVAVEITVSVISFQSSTLIRAEGLTYGLNGEPLRSATHGISNTGMAACTMVYLTYLKAGDLICIPYLTTMLSLPPERRTTFGVRKNTVRLSIGIEPPEKLIKDIKQALACVAQGVTLNG